MFAFLGLYTIDILKINQDIKLLLNKLCKNNLKEIKGELIKILVDNYNDDIINIFIKELLNKLWFDEGLINEYIYICSELWTDTFFKEKNLMDIIIKEFIIEFNKRDTYINQINNKNNDDTNFMINYIKRILI